jgi:hypothetical protein
MQHLFRNVGKGIGYGFFQLFHVLWFPVINCFLAYPHINMSQGGLCCRKVIYEHQCLPIYRPVKWSYSHAQTSFARWACTLSFMKWSVAMCAIERLTTTALKHFEVSCSIYCVPHKTKFNKCGCCDITLGCHLRMASHFLRGGLDEFSDAQ